jgi:hypothetical protein
MEGQDDVLFGDTRLDQQACQALFRVVFLDPDLAVVDAGEKELLEERAVAA